MRRMLLSVSSALIAVFLIGVATTSAAWASAWSVSLRAGSTGLATAQQAPAAPGTPTQTCNTVLGVGNTVTVSWTAVAHASSYTLFQATSQSGTYTMVSTVTGATTWTSGTLAAGSYWFKVASTVGMNWTSVQSARSNKRTISLVLLVWLCN